MTAADLHYRPQLVLRFWLSLDGNSCTWSAILVNFEGNFGGRRLTISLDCSFLKVKNPALLVALYSLSFSLNRRTGAIGYLTCFKLLSSAFSLLRVY